MSTDYYNLLGIDKNSSDSEIKKAYRKSALKWHPDRNKDDPAKAKKKFQEIGEAYSILSDPKKRDLYDKYGAEGLQNNGMDINPEDIFRNIFGGMGGMEGMGGMGGMPGMGGIPGMGIPFGMAGMAGMAGMGGMGGMDSMGKKNVKIQKGPDKKHTIDISIEDMMNGFIKHISLERKKKCYKCGGSGVRKSKCVNVSAEELSRCPDCKGSGTVFIQKAMGPMVIRQSATCTKCQGTGIYIENSNRCKVCKGDGIITDKEKLEINMDKGVKNNDTFVPDFSFSGTDKRQLNDFFDKINLVSNTYL